MRNFYKYVKQYSHAFYSEMITSGLYLSESVMVDNGAMRSPADLRYTHDKCGSLQWTSCALHCDGKTYMTYPSLRSQVALAIRKNVTHALCNARLA